MQPGVFSSFVPEESNQLLTEPVNRVFWVTEESNTAPSSVPFLEIACSNDYRTNNRGSEHPSKGSRVSGY